MGRWVLTAAAVSMGCASGAPAPATFCADLFGDVTTYAQTCCSQTDQQTPQYQALSQTLQSLAQTCTQALGQSVAKGRVQIDSAQASQCLAAVQTQLAALPCAQLQTVSVGALMSLLCHDAVAGQQDTGRFCAADYECQPGLTCVGFTGGTDGICQLPPPVGAACEGLLTDAGIPPAEALIFGTHPPCADDGWCANTCMAAGASGASCQANAQCAPDLYCHALACSTQAPAGTGPCLTDVDCSTGTYCESATSSCTPQKAAGASCVLRTAPAVSECQGICVSAGGPQGTCTSWCGSG
jgi:hypothetical protein